MSNKMSLQERAAMKREGNNAPNIARTYSAGSNGSQSPPAYSTTPNYTTQGPPPLLPRKPSAAGNYVTALYDYEAQADGDLSFSAGDRIQVTERKGPNEWWTGTCNGVQGVFPGNYVESA
jgi:amphiphysin